MTFSPVSENGHGRQRAGFVLMIRGSIEVATRSQVSGWIYAEGGSVHDRLILAFSGERCVGAGKVDRFRKDLLDAKLGDGYCGFDFPILLNDEEHAASVIVRLQNADVALLQTASKLVDAGARDGEAGGTGSISPAMLPWMQDKGWLDQHEYDFLRAIQTVGAYERGLRPPRRPNAELAPSIRPEQAVRDLVSLLVLGDVEVSRQPMASVSDLGGATSPLHGEGIAVVALWSQERCRIALDERSHLRADATSGAVTQSGSPGAVEYGFGPDRILFVHRHASFAPRGVAPAQGLSVFTARLREHSALRGVPRENRAA